MENFNNNGTARTPEIHFNSENGTLIIKGRSIPENSIEFYKPYMDWIDEYANSPFDSTTVTIQLEYFNTSSSKCLLDLFKKLERLENSNKNVAINWHYETDDEDMMEAGEDYQSIIDIPFNLIEINE